MTLFMETVMLSRRRAQKQPTPRHSLARNRALLRQTAASSGSGNKSWQQKPSAWSAANDHVNLLRDPAHCPLVYVGHRCACRASADLCLTVCCSGAV